MKIKIGIVIFCVLFILGFSVYQYFSIYDGRLHIVFCDVGQGDGIYIRTPNGTDIVIDAGRDDKILSCLSSHMPFWDHNIELAFATHPDADHIGGFVPILESYTVASFNTVEKTHDSQVFKKIQELISKNHVSLRFLYAGDTYQIGDGVAIRTFWPTHDFIEKSGESDNNRYSLVQTVSYNRFTMLTNGDIEADQLDTIFANGVSIDVFKLPHHGSKTGIDSRTFSLIQPKLGIISAGKNNSYGHPHREVLSELEKFKLKFLRTDQVGEIEILTDGIGFHLN